MTASSPPTAPHMLTTLVYGSHAGAPTFTTPIGGVGGLIHCRAEDWPIIRDHPILATPVVYVLLGDHAVARQRLYVGAGHDGANGIARHLYVKDREGRPATPWIRSIIASGATNGDLNIGQVEMMGHLLAAKARASGRVLCTNPKNEPKAPSVNELDLFACRRYLATLLRVCAVFTRAFIPTYRDISPIFSLKGPDMVCADGILTTRGFLVRAGAVGDAEADPSLALEYVERRAQLIESGVAKLDDLGGFTLTEDVEFKTAAGAAAVLGGFGLSKSAWRTGDGTSFAEVEDDLRGSLAQEWGS